MKSKESICVIKQQGSFKLYWEILIVIITFYNCFAIPLVLAFQPPEARSFYWDISNWVITGIFAIDMLINFRTSFYAGGDEIRAGGRMFCNYFISFSFLNDLITTIPFDLIGKLMGAVTLDVEKALSATRMLKIIRTGSINSLVASMRFERGTKSFIKVLQVVLFMVLFIHMQGCLYFFFVSAF